MPKLTFETKNALGIATLNNPPVNAIGIELIPDFQDILSQITISSTGYCLSGI